MFDGSSIARYLRKEGELEHGQEVGREFLKSDGDSAVLFEVADGALHHVAAVKDQPVETVRAFIFDLVWPLRNHIKDVASRALREEPSGAETPQSSPVAPSDADLRRLLAVWDRLSPTVRRSLTAIASAAAFPTETAAQG